MGEVSRTNDVLSGMYRGTESSTMALQIVLYVFMFMTMQGVCGFLAPHAVRSIGTGAPLHSKAIIWDCDGCLVDSEALLKTAEVEALHSLGFTQITVDDCNRMFSGFAPEAGMANFLAEFGHPLPANFFPDQIANSLQLFRDRLQPLNRNTVLRLHELGRKQVQFARVSSYATIFPVSGFP